MSLAILLLAIPPSRSDLLLLGWLSGYRAIGSQTRPNDRKSFQRHLTVVRLLGGLP
ncbi:hypothetical protein TorRG33x02_216390, partial [Trema orientale]